MSPKTIEILKYIAEVDSNLLAIIPLFPYMKYDNNFVFEEWKDKIDKESISYEDYSRQGYVVNNFSSRKPLTLYSYLQCIEYDDLETNWRIISCGMITMNHINIEYISELIDVCKNKNFEELLNFL